MKVGDARPFLPDTKHGPALCFGMAGLSRFEEITSEALILNGFGWFSPAKEISVCGPLASSSPSSPLPGLIV